MCQFFPHGDFIVGAIETLYIKQRFKAFTL